VGQMISEVMPLSSAPLAFRRAGQAGILKVLLQGS